ncbi:MAG: NAD(P)H-dependent glycerol-3-phosphate dehydrogenase [Castellaniella sp.]
MSRLRVTVLGAGSWGTALAALACPRAEVMLWARDPATAQVLGQQHRNPRYLPDIPLPENLLATHDFSTAVAHALGGPGDAAGLIVLGVPMAGLAETCAELARQWPPQSPALHVLWTCKGIQADSREWPHEIVARAFAGRAEAHAGVLSGPSFAREVALGLPVALTVASRHTATGHLAQRAFHGNQARIYTSGDIMGVQVGGAMKNIVAIACGISDGLRLGTNARAALITRGLAEIRRLGVALGAQADTFNGLTGLGDLVLTATGDLSRNRQAGVAIGQGEAPHRLLARGITVEGARCAQAARALGEQLDLDMPITDVVCQVLFEGLTPRQAVATLLEREPRPE